MVTTRPRGGDVVVAEVVLNGGFVGALESLRHPSCHSRSRTVDFKTSTNFDDGVEVWLIVLATLYGALSSLSTRLGCDSTVSNRNCRMTPAANKANRNVNDAALPGIGLFLADSSYKQLSAQ